jgi:hypothetical protein
LHIEGHQRHIGSKHAGDGKLDRVAIKRGDLGT